MKRTKRILIKTGLIVTTLTTIMCSRALAGSIDSFKNVEYSEEYKKWQQLSDEEKESTIAPPMYEIPVSVPKYTNPLLMANATRVSMAQKFSLKSLIPTNLTIRNQMKTNSCWTFAALSSLETNLAMSNYKRGTNTSKVYDYSERHMEYATSDKFLNNEKNENGYNRKVGSGGNAYIASSYLTNGTGAIDESEMPFENNENIISITEIQNKKVSSQVYDTIEFANYRTQSDADKKAEIMNQIKQHIKDNGAVFALLHGNSTGLFGITCYNNDTGAKYCNGSLHTADHAVSIIGWDDNYSVDNFAEGSRPSANGAWIVRNSWGERIECNLSELKSEFFEAHKQECISKGWNSAEEVPNSIIEKYGYTIENDIAYIKYGDNGIIYVSYEDYNISRGMIGIEKATDSTDYDNIYQYDRYYPDNQIYTTKSSAMLANVFNKKTTGTEYLTQVSLYAPVAYTCRVYVNPNGTSKDKSDLKEVTLKAGSTEKIGIGYHTLEFSEPIAITGDSFTVVVAAESDGGIKIATEKKIDNSLWNNVKVESNKCFVAVGNDLDMCQWQDLGQATANMEASNGTIKAYTTTDKFDDGSLKSIEIVTEPNKTSYFEGENFDKTGMVVKANYNSKKNPSVILDSSNYSITNGTNLKAGQTSVIITYEGKSVTQKINVEKNSVVSLQIKTPPTKTSYKEGENFDKTGMVVIANYKNGTNKTITNYTIKNGNNLAADQANVEIEFEGKIVKQAISVIANQLMEIKVTKAPNKTSYIEGQNFDSTGMKISGIYKDGSTQEILDYTVVNGKNLKVEQKSITISFKEKTVEQKITVEKKTITKIEISKNPTKMKYIQNLEELDLTGGKIKISYNDNSSEEISLASDQVTISGFSNKKLGTNKITVTYLNKTTTLNLEIIQEVVAENSDFSKINTKIESIKYYTFTSNANKEYVTIDMTISGIVKNTENDSYEYYYYLSENQNDNNIENWIKIAEKQSDSDKLKFTINSKYISNFEELISSKTLYLYVKEVVKKEAEQAVYTTKAINMESDVEIEKYLDNKKIENGNTNKKEDDKKTDKKDNTVAPGQIPQTGVKNKVFIIVIAIGALGIVCYIKYKKISKYVK